MCIKKGIKMNYVKKIAYVCALFCMTTGAAFGMDIFQAAATGNIGRIKELLANGAGVNQRDNFGFTALHLAASRGHEAVATRLIIELGADINQQSRPGMAALHCAAMNGHEAVVARLIELGADMNQTTYKGKTAVDIATAYNRHTIVALLNDYIQRIEQARQRAPVIAHILARATHPRLGAASPLALLPQDLLHYIAHLVVQTEAMDARRPRQSSDSHSWCIIS